MTERPPVTGDGATLAPAAVTGDGATLAPAATATGDGATLAAPLGADRSFDPAVVAGAVRSAADLPVVDRAQYRMLDEYARGGLGRIVRARDVRTGRQVAIKEMLGSSDDAARRFAREALITANLQHPAIVPVYELGRWPSGEPFYAMKLVSGASFEQTIAAATTLDARLSHLSVVTAVADALAFAHGKSIIHRDLKPANVLVGSFGETVVIDWGLAKAVGETGDDAGSPGVMPASLAPDRTLDGSVMGTPAYMPPEQARGEPADQRADVYAIGAMLYQLISGVPPFADQRPANLALLLALVAGGAPTPLARLEPGAPADLVTIVAKAMAPDVAARYPTAAELAVDLRRFTTGQLVGAHHYARRALVRRWLVRNRAAVTVGSVLVALLAAFAIVSVRRILAETDRAVEQSRVADQQRAAAEDQREAAVHQAELTRDALATALYQKGRVAETGQEWARAAMYYAASRVQHDTPEARWSAGLAEARALVPHARQVDQTAWVRGAAFSPDGTRVATVDDSGHVVLWSPVDGHRLADIAVGKRALYAVAFAPGGGELAVAGDDGTITRLAPDGRTLGTLVGHAGRVWSLAYAPDGTTLVSGGEDTTARLWTLATGAARVLRRHTQRVYAVVFAPAGGELITASDDRHAYAWQVATGAPLDERAGHPAGGIRVAAFTPTAELVTTGWDGRVHVRRPDGATIEWSDSGSVYAGALSPDGAVLVTGGSDHAIHVWDVASHALVTTLEGASSTHAVAFSSDGHWMVTGGEHGRPIAWDVRSLRTLTRVVGHRSGVNALAFRADGARFVSSAHDHTIRIWDLASATEVGRITTDAMCPDAVTTLDDDVIAPCDDATLRRWSSDGRELARLRTPGWIRYLDVAPDHRTLAGSQIGALVAIDVASWAMVGTPRDAHRHEIYDVRFEPDGELVTASLDDYVRLWHGRDFVLDRELRIETDDGVLTAARSPDRTVLATATQDGRVEAYDLVHARWIVHDLRSGGSLGMVHRLRFAPDGAHAYTASLEGVAEWDARTWTASRLLDPGEGAANAVVVSPDGKTLIGGYTSGAIVIWDLATDRLRRRIGGDTRGRGACSELALQAWVDDVQRATVTAACGAAPEPYRDALAARSHQHVVHDVDVAWDWD